MFKKILRAVKVVAAKLWVILLSTIALASITWWFFGILPSACIAISGIYIIFYQSQDYLVYHPNDPPDSRTFVLQPSQFEMPYESIKIVTTDGIYIHMYLIKHPNIGVNPPTILFFHGNAGNIGQRLAFARGLYTNLNTNILMVEYRGYGMSDGTPSEQGFYKDAQLVLEYLLERHDIDHSKIIVFGRSLGGAVAIDLASRAEYKNYIWSLIVENTFTSIPEMATVVLKWRCLKCVPRIAHKNKFASLEKIGHVTRPTLFVCGTNDSLVPPSMSEALHTRCAAINKQLAVIKGGSHDDTWTFDDYYPTLNRFIKSLPPLTKQPYYDEYTDDNLHSVIVHNV